MKSSIFGCKSFSHKPLPNCEVALTTAITGEEMKRKDCSSYFHNSNKNQLKMPPLLRLNSEGEICTGKYLCDTSANVRKPLGQSNSFNSLAEGLLVNGSLARFQSESTKNIPTLKKSSSVPVPAKSQAHQQPSVHPVSGASVNNFVSQMMDKFPLYSSEPRHLGSSDIFGPNQFGFDHSHSYSSITPSFQCSKSSSSYPNRTVTRAQNQQFCKNSNIDLHHLHKCNKMRGESRIAPDDVHLNLNMFKRSECASCGTMSKTSEFGSDVNFVNKEVTESSAKQQQQKETLTPKSKRRKRRRRKCAKKKPSSTTALVPDSSNTTDINIVNITDGREEKCEHGKVDHVEDIFSFSDNEKCLVQTVDTKDPCTSQEVSSKSCGARKSYIPSQFSDDDLIFDEVRSRKSIKSKKKSKPDDKKNNCSSFEKSQSCKTSDTESDIENNEKDLSSPISGMFFALNVTVSEDDEENDSSWDCWDSTGSPCPSASDQFIFELEFNNGLSLDVILGKKNTAVESMSEELRDVNERWNKLYKNSSDIKPSVDPKVHFASDDALATVHIVGNESREGEWYLYALERTRFKDRIDNIEAILTPVLCPSHRAKVLERMQE